MQFVEHHALQRGEQEWRVIGRQQQRQLLRCGEQDVRRIFPLPCPPRHRRVAGAGLHLDGQFHLGNRRFQITCDIDGESLEGGDVERVQAARSLYVVAGGSDSSCFAAQLDQCRKKTCQRFARAGRGYQQCGAIGVRFLQQCKLMSTRRPAPLAEPAGEGRWQEIGFGNGFTRRHKTNLGAQCRHCEGVAVGRMSEA